MKMKIESFEGIILSETNYSESSKILNILTSEYGKIGVISKGCRNLKSKLRSVSLKLTYANFDIYYKEGGLSTLISADIINDFLNIKSDLNRIGIASYLIDLTNQVLKDTSDSNIFSILEAALLKINDGFDPLVISNIVEFKYLEFLGVMPNLSSCNICGGEENIITISGDDGGYVCKNCYTNQFIVDVKTIKLLRMFSYVNIAKIKELNILDKNKKEINDFLEAYYNRYTGLYLKSKNFLKQIH